MENSVLKDINTMLVITIGLRCLHGSSGALLGVFALLLSKSLGPALGSPVKNVLAVFVHLELDDHDLAHLLALVVSSCNLNLVIFPQRHGPNSILGSELLREGSGHQAASDVRGGTEVSFAALRPVGGNVFVQFHILSQGKTLQFLEKLKRNRFHRGTTRLLSFE